MLLGWIIISKGERKWERFKKSKHSDKYLAKRHEYHIDKWEIKASDAAYFLSKEEAEASLPGRTDEDTGATPIELKRTVHYRTQGISNNTHRLKITKSRRCNRNLYGRMKNMRKHIVILLAFFFSITIQAQQYIPVFAMETDKRSELLQMLQTDENGQDMATSPRVYQEAEGHGNTSADDGYTTSDVFVDGKSIGGVTSYTSENDDSSHSLYEVFEEKTSIGRLVVNQKAEVSSAFFTAYSKYGTESSPKGVASVTAKGILTAKKVGKAKVFGYIKSGNKWIADMDNAVEISVEKPVISQKTVTLTQPEQLFDGFENITGCDIMPTEWQSQKPTVAAIDEGTGQITALTNGTTKITAMYGVGKNAAKYSFNVKVFIPVVSKAKASMQTGSTLKLTMKNTKLPVTWTSSDEDIAIVEEGKITAKNAGNVKIIGTVDNIGYSSDITVIPPEIKRAEVTIKVGKTTVVGLNKTKLKDIVWTSSDEMVATVDGKGKVTGLTNGKAIISTNAGGVENFCTVTVTGGNSNENTGKQTTKFSFSKDDFSFKIFGKDILEWDNDLLRESIVNHRGDLDHGTIIFDKNTGENESPYKYLVGIRKSGDGVTPGEYILSKDRYDGLYDKVAVFDDDLTLTLDCDPYLFMIERNRKVGPDDGHLPPPVFLDKIPLFNTSLENYLEKYYPGLYPKILKESPVYTGSPIGVNSLVIALEDGIICASSINDNELSITFSAGKKQIYFSQDLNSEEICAIYFINWSGNYSIESFFN